MEETRIYARAEAARQLVVYEMKLAAEGELAMVLPIPVAPGTTEIELVDLSGSPYFFSALQVSFLTEQVLSKQSRGGPTLAVQRVGAFEASFVPTASDFDRLDPRFAIPSTLWARIPEVQGFGFVVFKLHEPEPIASPSLFDRMLGRRAPTGLRAVHPMAFWFPRADRERLFFPTLHVHDGDVHAEAAFDHVLYAQTQSTPEGWEGSSTPFDQAMAGPGKSLVLPRVGARRALKGVLPNEDTWLDDRS